MHNKVLQRFYGLTSKNTFDSAVGGFQGDFGSFPGIIVAMEGTQCPWTESGFNYVKQADGP